MAGDEAAWVASEALIRVLGPASRYVGSDVAVPAALDFAIIFSSVVSQLAVIQGFHLLEDRDIADTYADFITPLFGKAWQKGCASNYRESRRMTSVSLMQRSAPGAVRWPRPVIQAIARKTRNWLNRCKHCSTEQSMLAKASRISSP